MNQQHTRLEPDKYYFIGHLYDAYKHLCHYLSVFIFRILSMLVKSNPEIPTNLCMSSSVFNPEVLCSILSKDFPLLKPFLSS